jgi:hypothetical protein
MSANITFMKSGRAPSRRIVAGFYDTSHLGSFLPTKLAKDRQVVHLTEYGAAAEIPLLP